MDQRISTEVRVLALYLADSGWIPNPCDGPLALPRVIIPEFRAWGTDGCVCKTKTQEQPQSPPL